MRVLILIASGGELDDLLVAPHLGGTISRDQVIVRGSRTVEDQRPHRIPTLIMTIRCVALVSQAVVPVVGAEEGDQSRRVVLPRLALSVPHPRWPRMRRPKLRYSRTISSTTRLCVGRCRY